jgi:hypothetical protein
MARLVTCADEMNEVMRVRRTVIREGSQLPENVFEANYSFFRMLDAARIPSDEFFEAVISLVRDSRIGQVAMVMIDPDPVEWYIGCGRYGAVIFDGHDTPDDVLHVCMEYPPDQPQWSISLVASIVALFPISRNVPDWCVYRDCWNCEVGIAAFKNEKVMQDFIEKDIGHVMTDAREAIETFMALGFHPMRVVPDDFKREFLGNYTDKRIAGKPER